MWTIGPLVDMGSASGVDPHGPSHGGTAAMRRIALKLKSTAGSHLDARADVALRGVADCDQKLVAG